VVAFATVRGLLAGLGKADAGIGMGPSGGSRAIDEPTGCIAFDFKIGRQAGTNLCES
jgi:hypothetical protein